ncbi:hypothetical protein [Amycolatopsis benzoatilytica]|uniref:hypothetical protein n=1 Tax=Amycolatopsis benzoatilytica TaxID=346045 RepID=UPI0003680512|nr:hypothetical protein [Amycolatopsis benzoatilytica]
MTSLITDDSGATAHRGPLHRGIPVPRTALPDASSLLHRLSSLASLRAWEQRSTPALMHQAILGGANACQAAEAAHLTVADAHLCWCVWATKQLDRQHPDLTVEQFLTVHGAFATVLSHAQRAATEQVRR